MKLFHFLFSITGLLLLLHSDANTQTKMTDQQDAQGQTYKATMAGWLVNIDEAYAISKKTGKPILANFTGSDWCGWCKRLKANVFDHNEFKMWADQNVVLLELDFPRSFKVPAEIQQQNMNLQQAFQVQGYPTVWVFDLQKDQVSNQYTINALGKTGYTATPGEFIDGVNKMIGKN